MKLLRGSNNEKQTQEEADVSKKLEPIRSQPQNTIQDYVQMSNIEKHPKKPA